MPSANAFPLDVPDFNDRTSIRKWQQRVVDKLEFTEEVGATTSTNATTSLINLALQPVTVYFIESWVLGVLRSTSGSLPVGQSMLNIWYAGAKLNASGNAVFVGGSPTKFYSGANFSVTTEPWTTALTTNGNTVRQTVTGTLVDVVSWLCRIKIYQVES